MPLFLSESEKYASCNLGEWTYGAHGGPHIESLGEGELSIGRFCSIARDVVILLGGEHRSDWITTYPFPAIFPEAARFSGHPRTKGDVVIGHDVWIGVGVLILSGVEIGNGAVIGARSVVTNNVKPYSIVAGVPARLIRYRFDQDQIKQLQNIQWWNWPLEKIKESWPDLLSPKIEVFLSKYGTSSSVSPGGTL